MTKEFLESVLRIPTTSGHEEMVTDFIVEWAGKHGCSAKKDGKGNVFLTKGKPPAGHFYPASCDHVDTVHRDQQEMIEQNVFKAIVWSGDEARALNPLKPKEDRRWAPKADAKSGLGRGPLFGGSKFSREEAVDVEISDDGKYKVVDKPDEKEEEEEEKEEKGEEEKEEKEEAVEMGRQTGIGADDLCGVAIALDALDSVPYGKAAFFVEEEIGCQGSKSADMSFFDDCAFCFSNDSPEGNRAAKSCSGTPLFSEEFFDEHLKDVCSEHGLTNFRHEPFTDVIYVRKHDLPGGGHLECLNFGNGGYDPHRDTEYVKFSETKRAAELLKALFTSIPLDKQYKSEIESPFRQEQPQYGGGYGGYGGYSGYDGYDWGSAPTGGAWWAKKPASGGVESSDVDRRGEFEFVFSKKEYLQTAKLAVGSLKRRLEGKLQTKFDETTLKAKGTILALKYAYMACFNAENQTRWTRWDDFVSSVPKAKEAFKKALKTEPEKPKAKPGEDAGGMFSFGVYMDEDEGPEFETALVNVPEADEADVEFKDGGMVVVEGPLDALKAAWAVVCAVTTGSEAKKFDGLTDEEKQEFKDALTPAKRKPEEDEKGGIKKTVSDFWSWWNRR